MPKEQIKIVEATYLPKKEIHKAKLMDAFESLIDEVESKNIYVDGSKVEIGGNVITITAKNKCTAKEDPFSGQMEINCD